MAIFFKKIPVSGDTLLCGGTCEHAKEIALHVVPSKLFFRFPSELKEHFSKCFLIIDSRVWLINK